MEWGTPPRRIWSALLCGWPTPATSLTQWLGLQHYRQGPNWKKHVPIVKLAFFARAHCCLDVMQCRTTWFACSIFLLAHYNSYTSGRVPISYFKADQEHLRASTCQCMAPDKAGGGLTRSLELQDCLFRLRGFALKVLLLSRLANASRILLCCCTCLAWATNWAQQSQKADFGCARVVC